MDAIWWEEYCDVFSKTEDARKYFDDRVYANEKVKKWIYTEEYFLLIPGEEKPVFIKELDEKFYFNEKWTEVIESLMEYF
ncbi:MAG: hypothetical protein IJH82_06825 [Lachnospiraceae bacterium]|nr:hypothetical protein [Lachnospiraceae bacterium]